VVLLAQYFDILSHNPGKGYGTDSWFNRVVFHWYTYNIRIGFGGHIILADGLGKDDIFMGVD